TSYGTKDNVSNLVGGRCRTHNMKMKLYVCIDQSDPLCPNGNKERTSVAINALGTLSVGAVVGKFH
ncbi:hypothetical protein QZH41_015151, partial [Actinostola sp. cb2023]